jgi:probable addiction module antidote protein
MTTMDTEFDLDRINALAPWRASDYLNTPDEVAAYLNERLADDDAGLLAFALGDLVRARGVAAIAKDAGFAREVLYKALRQGARPRLDTIMRVLGALGLQLTVVVK